MKNGSMKIAMPDAIGKAELQQMFIQAADRIRREHQRLSELDSVAGDGDHGTTMLRVVEQLEASAGAAAPENLRTRLREVGWNVMGVDGGASSALLGTFFAGMADAEIDESSMDCGDVARALESGLRAVSKQTKAQPGDKTLIDALQPAVNAFSAAAASGKDICEALRDAARAARAGADSTKNQVARYGRAKFLGEKTLGSPDAGATSVALLFNGFCAAFATEGTS
jgi:phosphoenolpyruvate---glycerone phosphotransferase subunit DhaL